MIPTVTILEGDCLTHVKQLPEASVHCCVTSPPYWGLRDYGVEGQLGLEKTPEEYVEKMVEVFREVGRVLRHDATLWLNLGDSYAGGGNYRGVNSESTLSDKQRSNGGARGVSQLLGSAGKEYGIAPKNLVGIPWRMAFALQADGWWLRSDIIWSKPNPMPESVTDRPTKSHEYLFLLAKSERYYYDAESIKEQSSFEAGHTRKAFTSLRAKAMGRKPSGNEVDGWVTESGFRNKRSVWTVPSSPYAEAHFASYPPDLIKPCILAGCPVGGTVLDPFAGSGTTGQVALELGRSAILIELNPAYVQLIRQRTNVTPGFQLGT